MEECKDDTSTLETLLAAEFAFSRRARESIRDAFLEFLAAGSLVLQPVPVSGRTFYAAAKDNADKLEWYPTMADLSASGDVGFTTGPWTYTAAAGGTALQGDFLTIWKRDAACRWLVELDSGISHAVPAQTRLPVRADSAPPSATSGPPKGLVAADAPGAAIHAFQETCRLDGFAPAVRTYARTSDFLLYMDGELPMALAAANRHLSVRAAHAVAASWEEAARGRSADSSLVYAVGVIGGANQGSRYAYVQIWQYAAKVANWGLRILLMNPLSRSMSR